MSDVARTTRRGRRRALRCWASLSSLLLLSLIPHLTPHSLLHSYGWRTVKRPGLDSFLLQLQPYYEVVLFTDESNAIAETTVNRLDKFNLFHRKLYRDATTRVDGRLRKDLERLNRDLSDVVVVDCDPEQALYCQRRNGIAIEPFTDPENRDDDALLTLLPLLKEIATQPAADARDILSFFAGRNATDGAVDAEGATEESITPYPAATLVKNHATTLASKSAQAKRGLRGVLDLPADDAAAAGEAPMMLPANAPAVQDDEMPSLSQLGGIAKSVLMGEEVAPLAPKAAPGVGRRKKARASRAPTYWEKMHQEEKTVREEEEAKMMAEMKG